MAMTGAFVAVVVLSALGMEVIVVMGMGMIVTVCMGVGMGVSNTVMGVFVGMGVLVVMGMTAGNQILMNMHNASP